MFLAQIIESGFRSAAIIGLGKNTGKTFALNQLLMEGRRLGIIAAITSIGLDGEERDSVLKHNKPKIQVSPGQIIATAKALLLASGLDYEILSMTGIMTQLGEVVLARAKSFGQTLLAGPSTRYELARMQGQLEQYEHDLLLVDGAVDRRSLAAPMATDTTIFAVGAEVAWERSELLEKLKLQWRLLTLPSLDNPSLAQYLQNIPADVKMVISTGQDVRCSVSHREFSGAGGVLAEYIARGADTVFIRGMVTDELLAKVLAHTASAAALTLLVPDSTHVFLSKQSFQRLASRNAALKVLNSIHISAVTVNPFNSRYGYAEPIRLLEDVGQAVDPVPCYDLFLGIRYEPEGDVDAIS